MKDELVYFAKRIYYKGLSPAASGNISLVDNSGHILITASGSCAGDLTFEDIVKTDMDGKIFEGIKKPSSELLMHIQIYKNRPDIKAIIHSHSPEITAFAVAGQKIDKVIMPEFVLYFGEIPIARYHLPSSTELANEVGKYFKFKKAVLMENHGIVVGGKTIKEAFYLLESIQAYCKTFLNAKILGSIKTLNSICIKEIDKLKS